MNMHYNFLEFCRKFSYHCIAKYMKTYIFFKKNQNSYFVTLFEIVCFNVQLTE